MGMLSQALGRYMPNINTPRSRVRRHVRLILLLILGGLIVGVSSIWRQYKARIFPGVFIDRIAVGEKTLEEAKALLEQQTAYNVPETLNVTIGDQTFSTPSASLKMQRNDERALQEAMLVGRGRNMLENLRSLAKLLIHDEQIPLTYSVDRDILLAWSKTIAKKVEIAGKAPIISLKTSGNAKTLVVTPGVTSQHLPVDAFTDAYMSYLVTYSSSQVEPFHPPLESQKALSEEELTRARERAASLVGKSLVATYDDKKLKLNDQALLSLVLLPTGYKTAEIEKTVHTWATTVEKPMQEPAMTVENGKVTAFTPPQTGTSLDAATAQAKLLDELAKLEKQETVDEFALPIMKTEPKKSLASTNNLGIKERIGHAETYFFHSIPNRVHNVELTAQRINLTLIPKDGVFSYNKTVGDVDRAHGFLPAYIIQQGRTVLGDGGGLCQASSNMFRVALNAGLPIVQRRGHSYRVSYYEENSKPGVDATVFAPSVDFQFKNDTPANILVTVTVDPKNYHMVIDLWGTSDGRTAEIQNLKVWDVTGPKPTIYQDDPSLPRGTIKQVDFAAGGAKASFTYHVTRDGKVLQNQEFKTVYQAWAAVYLRGTGN